MDPLQVVKVYADIERSHTRHVKCLSILSKKRIHALCPDVNIDDIVRHQELPCQSDVSSTYVNPVVNFDDFLKTLALKLVTVTVPRLSTEIVQLWTKTH